MSKYENGNAGNSNFYFGLNASSSQNQYIATGNGSDVNNFGSDHNNLWKNLVLVYGQDGNLKTFVDGVLTSDQSITKFISIKSEFAYWCY